MRLLRVLAIATGFAALAAQPSAAQDGRQFKDAWFWGVKGGGLVYASASTTAAAAPLVGAEWLITRTRGGLYVAYDQAFLTTNGAFVDRDPDSLFFRDVRLTNLRRVTIAAMVFPMQSNRLHPYAGLGMAFSQIAGARLLTGPTTGPRYAVALDSIQARKAGFSPILLAGTQMRLRPVSVFGQVTASPTQQAFFLSNSGSSRAWNVSLEFGARYNVGSSIDRAR